MSYPVDNIISLDILLTPAGLAAANFNTAFIFATQDDLADGVTFANDTFKDYASLTEVLEDFAEDSAPALIATRWFANLPSPPQISVYMWDDDVSTGDSPTQVAAKAVDAAWRYWLFFPRSVLDNVSDVESLADFGDAEGHFVSFVIDDANAVDPNDDTDLGSTMTARGNRRFFVGYRETATITDDDSQAYANAQTAAAFQKFNPDGDRTAITAEYQVLPGVVGESLNTSSYNSLTDKNIVFWTAVELQGSVDASRTINTKTTSSFGEFIDDVVNLDVLKNRMQVAGYNYIANAGSKRGLTERGYAGLLSALEGVLKQFYNNGVLGRATYTDPATGEEQIAKYGYVIFSSPEDVLDLTASQRTERKYPPVQILAILARAGHTVEITVNVE